MVLSVFFLNFGLPNILPLRVGIYSSHLPMSPVNAHADLVRESNRRLDSLIFVVTLFLSGPSVLIHLMSAGESGK